MKRAGAITGAVAAALGIGCNQQESAPAPPAVVSASDAAAPSPPHEIVPDAAVAAVVAPPDSAVAAAAPPDAADSLTPARDRQRARDAERRALEAEAEKYAQLLTGDDSQIATLDRRRPGADLGAQLADSSDLGHRGGGANPCGGASRPGIEPPVAGPAPSNLRIAVTKKQALDASSLDVDAVTHKIQAAYVAGLKRCYRQVLERDATARGTVTIHFTVSESGRVSHASVTSFADDLTSCVETLASSWRFAAPKDGDAEPTAAAFELALALSPE